MGKSPPQDNRVEIAYFTFPGYEGQGVATRMAQALVQIAFEARPELTIAAQTLPEESASTNVLKKLGFQFTVELEHPEVGKVWEWRLKNSKIFFLSITPPAIKIYNFLSLFCSVKIKCSI